MKEPLFNRCFEKEGGDFKITFLFSKHGKMRISNIVIKKDDRMIAIKGLIRYDRNKRKIIMLLIKKGSVK